MGVNIQPYCLYVCMWRIDPLTDLPGPLECAIRHDERHIAAVPVPSTQRPVPRGRARQGCIATPRPLLGPLAAPSIAPRVCGVKEWVAMGVLKRTGGACRQQRSS